MKTDFVKVICSITVNDKQIKFESQSFKNPGKALSFREMMSWFPDSVLKLLETTDNPRLYLRVTSHFFFKENGHLTINEPLNKVYSSPA